ncbi:MAG: hypothetical protein K5776_04885 [Lachnospiraceae bacterium]|nr:hypothetical protein [Lachnospiraceae bacterium]
MVADNIFQSRIITGKCKNEVIDSDLYEKIHGRYVKCHLIAVMAGALFFFLALGEEYRSALAAYSIYYVIEVIFLIINGVIKACQRNQWRDFSFSDIKEVCNISTVGAWVMSIVSLIMSIVSLAISIAYYNSMSGVTLWRISPAILFFGLFLFVPAMVLEMNIFALDLKGKDVHRILSVIALVIGIIAFFSAFPCYLILGNRFCNYIIDQSVLTRDEGWLYAVEQKYNEKFYLESGYYHPENYPNVLISSIYDEATSQSSTSYRTGYVEQQIEEVLSDELQEFFPGAYVVVYTDDPPYNNLKWSNTDDDFRGKTLKENLKYIEEGSCCDVVIFINRDEGTRKMYDEEYDYFTTQLDERIKNHEMVELSVHIFMLDSQQFEYAKTFENPSCYSMWDRSEWGEYESSDLETGYKGNPPNMYVCLIKDKPAYEALNRDVYVRSRKLLERDW